MQFEFQHRATGHVIERSFAIGKAPQRVRFEGRVYHRKLSSPTIASAKTLHFQSGQLPPWWKHARNHDPATGECRFESHAEIQETIRRARDAGEHVTYNDRLDGAGMKRAPRDPDTYSQDGPLPFGPERLRSRASRRQRAR